ncbi:MAG: hypothetical protein GC190_20790 [Alphaproteobacteria bacterium]|nr:hypothetical protein [Alphaproteobacteria bacterium]
MSNETARIRMFRQRASEIRKIAKDIGDKDCRASLIEMAEYYENLAAGLQSKRKREPSVKRH